MNFLPMASNNASDGSRMYTSGNPAPQLVFFTCAPGKRFANEGGTCPVKAGSTGVIPIARSAATICCCSALCVSIQCAGNGPPQASTFPIQNQEKYAGPQKK